LISLVVLHAMVTPRSGSSFNEAKMRRISETTITWHCDEYDISLRSSSHRVRDEIRMTWSINGAVPVPAFSSVEYLGARNGHSTFM